MKFKLDGLGLVPTVSDLCRLCWLCVAAPKLQYRSSAAPEPLVWARSPAAGPEPHTVWHGKLGIPRKIVLLDVLSEGVTNERQPLIKSWHVIAEIAHIVARSDPTLLCQF